MYKMDILTDLSSNTEWGLDLLGQPNGLFGDLNHMSHLTGDINPASKPRDAVEQLSYSPVSEEPLDLDWMESGDLGSLLDALNDGQDRLLSLQDGLFDCSQEINVNKFCNNDLGKPVGFSQVEILEQCVTPPESPEQVAPVIKLDPDVNNLWSLSEPHNITTIVSSPSTHIVVPDQDYATSIISSSTVSEFQDLFNNDRMGFQSELFETSEIFGLPLDATDLGNSTGHVTSESICVEDGIEFSLDEVSNTQLCPSYSSDDGSSISSPSNTASPRPNIDSLIQSSPELYKVIATPSNLSGRFSPYSKSRGDQKIKGDTVKPSKTKAVKPSLEPLPEELFPSNIGKKERKKLQNKNAAIRYRQKKKVEVECVVNEVQTLEQKNHDLKTKVDDLQREVKYMKSLMEEIYKAKGLVK